MWGKKEHTTSAPESYPNYEPEATQPAPAPPAPPVATRTVAEPATSAAQFGKSLKLKGEISGSEDLYVDGEVKGSVVLKDHALTVGPHGKVHADIQAKRATILGQVKGNVRATERVEIRKTGAIEGDLITANISIEEGATFRGTIDIVRPGQSGVEVTSQARKPVERDRSAKSGAEAEAAAPKSKAERA